MTIQISILHNMARSGGTLISKCLGCMENVVLLSEIHPYISTNPFNPITQAQEWHNLLLERDRWYLQQNIDISWTQAIEVIHRRTLQAGKQLILRDWSHIDFTGKPWFDNPSYKFTCVKILEEYFDIKNICTVRHPIDQWLSLSKLSVINNQIDLPTFLRGYRKFAECAVETGFLRYEDFTHSPEESLKLLCENLAVNYDSTYSEKWFNYTKITGDTKKNSSGRATGENTIVSLPRKSIPTKLKTQFQKNNDYNIALRLLGYNN